MPLANADDIDFDADNNEILPRGIGIGHKYEKKLAFEVWTPDAGLGLAIARRITELHGGQLMLLVRGVFIQRFTTRHDQFQETIYPVFKARFHLFQQPQAAGTQRMAMDEGNCRKLSNCRRSN